MSKKIAKFSIFCRTLIINFSRFSVGYQKKNDKIFSPAWNTDEWSMVRRGQWPGTRCYATILAEVVCQVNVVTGRGNTALGRVFQTGLEWSFPGQLDDPGGWNDNLLVRTQITNIILCLCIKALICFMIGKLAPRTYHSNVRSTELWPQFGVEWLSTIVTPTLQLLPEKYFTIKSPKLFVSIITVWPNDEGWWFVLCRFWRILWRFLCMEICRWEWRCSPRVRSRDMPRTSPWHNQIFDW